MNLSYVQLDLDALRSNVQALRTLLTGGQRVVAVVKANAYGHGLKPVARALEPYVDAFQVDDIEELRELRSISSVRTLVLGYVPRAQLAEAIAWKGELGVFDREHLEDIGKAAAITGSHVTVHLKIDSLLGRLGVLPSGASAMCDELERWPSIHVDTAYAHFANIEDTTDLVHAGKQAEVFNEAFEVMRARLPDLRRHLSATSGAMTMENPANDYVRLGIGLYGMYPSEALKRTHSELSLRPVARWVSHLAQVKELPAGHPVGYGLTYVTSRPTRIGIVPQGYSDGYDRGLSNSGEVLVRGRRCPVLGRVAMNMFAVDLSEVPSAEREDEAVLLGAQGNERITAEEIAAKLGTINYEVTARINPLLARIV